MFDVYLRGHFGERYSAVLFLKNCFVLNDEDGFTAADKELMKRTEQEVDKMMAEDDDWDEFQRQAAFRPIAPMTAITVTLLNAVMKEGLVDGHGKCHFHGPTAPDS